MKYFTLKNNDYRIAVTGGYPSHILVLFMVSFFLFKSI